MEDKIKVGDKICIIQDTTYHTYKIGTILTVKNIRIVGKKTILEFKEDVYSAYITDIQKLYTIEEIKIGNFLVHCKDQEVYDFCKMFEVSDTFSGKHDDIVIYLGDDNKSKNWNPYKSSINDIYQSKIWIEFSQIIKAEEMKEYKVGDIVKIISIPTEAHWCADSKYIGALMKITTNPVMYNGGLLHTVQELNTNFPNGGLSTKHFVKATQEEINEYLNPNKLPEEYIVECKNVEQLNEVLNNYYNTSGFIVRASCFVIAICKKSFQNVNFYTHDAFEEYIHEEYTNLSIFTYNQWQSMKQTQNKQEIESVEVIKAFPGVKKGSIFSPCNMNSDRTIKDFNGSGNLCNFNIPIEEVQNTEFFKIHYKAKYELPKINNYSGKLEGEYIIYRSNCAKFKTSWFKNIGNTKSFLEIGTNRTIKSIELSSGVKISAEELTQIKEYLENQ